MSFEVHEKFFKNLMSKKDKGTEYTFRGDLEVLLNEIKSDDKIKIIQEAKKNEEKKGKPDFKIIKNDLIIGYIETKNLTINLSEIIDKDNQSRDAVQFRKYLELTNNLILTNYKDYMLCTCLAVSDMPQ